MALPVYLFVIPWSLEHRGGVNQVVLSLAREMQAAGQYEPLVLITDWDAVTPDWDDFEGIRTVRWRVHGWHPGMGWRKRLFHRLWARSFAAAFRTFCRAHSVAAINIHYPGNTALSLQRICRWAEAPPLILSFHGTDVAQLGASSAAHRQVWLSLLCQVRAVTTCSADLAQQLHRAVGSGFAITSVHNGVDAPAFRANAVERDAPAGRFILTVGKFDHIKGQDVLLDAFASLAARYPDLQLVLAGMRGAALPQLQAQAAALHMADRVHFRLDLAHAEVAGLLQKADLFVLPSRREAFGMVLLEAGVFGLPAVASAVGGVPEIIRDRETGRLVRPEDVKELAQAVAELLDAPPLAQRLGAALRRSVEGSFSWRAAYRHYIGLLS